jgi:hypothetical protein
MLSAVKSPWFTVAVAILISGDAAYAQTAQDQAVSARIEKKLHRIIVPKLEFRDATFREALDFLKKKSIELDDETPRHHEPSAFKTVLQISLPSQEATQAAPLPPPITAATANTRITLSLTNVSLYEALQSITKLAGVTFWIGSGAIHFTSPMDPEPMLTRDYRIPAGFFPAFAKQDRLDHTATVARMKADFRTYLVARGAHFAEGTAAILNDEATRLTVHNGREELETIASILKNARPPAAFPVPGPKVPKVIGSDEARESTEAKMKAALDRMIIAKVEFTGAHLRDVIDTLIKAESVDEDGNPQERHGVNLVLRMTANDVPDETPGSPLPILESGQPPVPLAPAIPGIPGLETPPNFDPASRPDEVEVTYTATKVSLWEALQAVARLSGLCVSVESNVVVLAPPDHSAVLREYLIPPVWTPEMEKLRLTENIFRGDAPAPANLSIDPASGSNYIASKGRLIVQATEAEHKPIREIVEALWRDFYLAHPAPADKQR